MKFNHGERAREYGRRGRKALTDKLRHNVEGEHLTSSEIATRINRSSTTANHRLNREKAKPGPVTWAGLMEP